MNGDSDVVRADLLLGGRYRLLRPIGVGGMAVVWQARDHVLARTVAVKVLATEHMGDPDSRDRIRREAQAAAAIAHPNIVQVHDYGETSEAAGAVLPYVVMELVPGGTLLQRMADGPLTSRFAMRVCAEIAAALAAAHAEGLVHRDVKPANVMLPPTGAKVVDFGIAAGISAEGFGTDDDIIYGTPAYLAPERLVNDSVEPASDVYALGVILYLMLTGHTPWTVDDTTAMLSAHIYLEPPPLPPLPGVPDYVIALGNRCLLKDPSTRPSAGEAAEVLAQGAGLRVVTDEPDPDDSASAAAAAADDEPSVLVRPRPAPSESGPGGRGKRMIALWALAVLLVAGVGAAAWRLLSDEPTTGPSASSPVAGSSLGPTSATPARPSATAPTSSAATAATAATSGDRGSVGSTPTPTPPGATPGTTPATTRPAPETTGPAQPVEQTFTSDAGVVRATCPSAETAQILSAKATKPYKIATTDAGPGSAPSVTFKRGDSLVTMTVQCASGTPSVTVT